jgi:hypothetical protein
MAAVTLADERPPSTPSGAPAARPRGRPLGARAAVVRDVRAIGLHHFAFLRACLLGLDLAKSFERYLAWGETTSDLRHVEARRRELLTQLVDAGRRLDLTLPADGKIKRYVDLLANEAVFAPPAHALFELFKVALAALAPKVVLIANAGASNIAIDALPLESADGLIYAWNAASALRPAGADFAPARGARQRCDRLACFAGRRSPRRGG